MRTIRASPSVSVRCPLLEEQDPIIWGRGCSSRISARYTSTEKLDVGIRIDSKPTCLRWLRRGPGIVNDHPIRCIGVCGARAAHGDSIVLQCKSAALDIVQTWIEESTIDACRVQA